MVIVCVAREPDGSKYILFYFIHQPNDVFEKYVKCKEKL